MDAKQIKLPDNYTNADIVKTILGLIQYQIDFVKRELIIDYGEQGRLEGQHQAIERYDNDIDNGIGFGSDINFENRSKQNQKLIRNHEEWLKYYEACRTYVELNLIDKLYPEEKNED